MQYNHANANDVKELRNNDLSIRNRCWDIVYKTSYDSDIISIVLNMQDPYSHPYFVVRCKYDIHMNSIYPGNGAF